MSTVTNMATLRSFGVTLTGVCANGNNVQKWVLLASIVTYIKKQLKERKRQKLLPLVLH
jgi:hypothetical protein